MWVMRVANSKQAILKLCQDAFDILLPNEAEVNILLVPK